MCSMLECLNEIENKERVYKKIYYIVHVVNILVFTFFQPFLDPL